MDFCSAEGGNGIVYFVSLQQGGTPNFSVRIELSQFGEHSSIGVGEAFRQYIKSPVIATHIDEDYIRSSVLTKCCDAQIGTAGGGLCAIDCTAGVGIIDAENATQTVNHLHPPGIVNRGDAGNTLIISVVKNGAGRRIPLIGADGIT